MAPAENDVPLSIALVSACAVGFAWYYCSFLRFHPEVSERIALALEEHSRFWSATTIIASINLALVGSWLRRTVGMQKQGSRLKQLESSGFRFRLRFTDFYATVLATATAVVSSTSVRAAIGAIGPIFSAQAVAVLSLVLCANYGLGILAFGAPIFRKLSDLKLRVDGNLAPPPFEKLSLVLGTTPFSELN